ncbi:hypothetical protein CDD83_3931 [Cordyceps sp. RAO-2017]|nr:hypothetical protein CDD83_3931 [Cordyceps sp. RAO-2017]
MAMLLAAAGVLASPAPGRYEPYPPAHKYQPCSKAGFFGSSPACCSLNILGAASLGCKPRALWDQKAKVLLAQPGGEFPAPTGGEISVIYLISRAASSALGVRIR